MIIPRRRRAEPPPPWVAVLVPMIIATAVGFALLTERAGLPLTVLASLGVYAGLSWLMGTMIRLRRARLAAGQAEVAPPEPPAPPRPVDGLLQEADSDIRRLLAAARASAAADQPDLLAIADHAAQLCQHVDSDPQSLDRCMRLLTFYLPAARDLAEDRIRLGARIDPARATEIGSTLARVRTLFEAATAGAAEPELRGIDIDVKMIQQALREDG